jgi:hypothetical protein
LLESLTVNTFSPLVGEVFRLHLDPAPPLDLELIDASALGTPDPRQTSPRKPFAIVFRGPGGVYAPQRTYRLEHRTLGAFDLFLVPIGPDDRGMRYEAVFS